MRYNRRTVDIVSARDEDVIRMVEAKDFCRVQDADDEPLLSAFIGAAVEAAELYTRRAIRELTLDLTLDGFSAMDDDALVRLGPGMHQVPLAYVMGTVDGVELPRPPIVSITSVTTYNRANVAAVFPSASYTLAGSRLALNDGYTWPTDLRDQAAVKVRYVAGYGPNLPAPMKLAILQHVSAMYDCRSGCEMPVAARSLLNSYRIMDGLAW